MDASQQRMRLKASKRWVVKVGSSLISGPQSGIDRQRIALWSNQIMALRDQGVQLSLVSSGAVAAGMERMGVRQRPEEAGDLRALAAIGQPGLVHAYESVFAQRNTHTALLLLTHEDFYQRTRYLNIRSTLQSLLKIGVVPVLNENDTVVNDELRFGDNDILAALVADLVSASVLVILTDRPGLCDKNPAKYPDAQLISTCQALDSNLLQHAEGSGQLGQGGMISKLKAARYAARSGCLTLIADGREERVLERLYAGEEMGTMLLPPTTRLAARKRWIYGQQRARGKLIIDDGAVNALVKGGKSLLLVGVLEVEGEFGAGDIVACVGRKGEEIAYGVCSLSSYDARRLKGMVSDEITETYGNDYAVEIIHRNDLALKHND